MLGNERNKSVFENIFRIPKTKKEKQRAIILLIILLSFFIIQRIFLTDGEQQRDEIRKQLRNLGTPTIEYVEILKKFGSESEWTLIKKIDTKESLRNFTVSLSDALDWKPNHPIISKIIFFDIHYTSKEICTIQVAVLYSDNETAYIYLPANKSFSYKSKKLMSWMKKERFVP